MPHLPIPRPLIAATTACMLMLAPMGTHAQGSPEQGSPAPVAEPTPIATDAPALSPEGSWVVTALDPWQTGLMEPLPGSLLRLSFLDEGRLQGETACGRFTGGWSGEGGELFAGIAPTGFLGCAEEQTGEAIGLNTAIEAVVEWQPDDAGGIELLDASGATRLTLQPLMVGDPAGTWLVLRFRRPNGEWAEPVADGPMMLTLHPDGFLEGGTGCRLLLGGYSYDAGDITIGPFDTEGLPCDGAAGRAERRLLRALGETTTWGQNGDELILSDEERPVVELIRVPERAE